MPGENNLNSGFISMDAELNAIKKVLKVFEEGHVRITEQYAAQLAKAQSELENRESKAKKELINKISELYAEGLIKSEKEAYAYAQSQERDRTNQRLKDEIEILKTIGALKAQEDKKQEERLKAEKEILEARNKVAEREAAIEALKAKPKDQQTPDDQKELKKAEEQLKAEKKAAREKEKEAAKKDKKDKKEQHKQDVKDQTAGYEFWDEFKGHFTEFTDALADDNHVKKVADENIYNAVKGTLKAVEDSLNAVNQAISEYAKYQAGINSRLQGVGSYADSIKTLSSVAYSPLLKAEDLYANLADLVGQGIVTNVEQRAMFATMKDAVAGTFDVTADSLKRLIRVQQNDSTAARMGMEAYLTRFLNVYVENTEYLQSTFDTVSNSLLEASAMMYLSNKSGGAGASAELEYVVQKWLGTLSGIGLSDTAAQSIADAIGQLGSGNIDALGSSDIQNLIVMAASKVGLNYGEMLNSGIDSKQANDLMLGVVEYLQDVAATGTNVVKSQLANVFGVTVSDLVAVSNLGDSALKKVHSDLLSYSSMYGELTSQFKELPGRLGISNILENLFSNLTYQTGMGIASNPVTYALWKITDMIQGVTGGINVPFISAFGNGFDLNTTVENLMKLGIVGISTLGSIGKIASGLASIGDGSILLKKLQVSQGTAVIKTTGGSSMSNGQRQSGSTTTESTYVGNNDGDTYSDAAQNAANDEAQSKLDQKSSEYEDPVVKYLDEELKLGSLLEDTNSKIDTLVESQSRMVQSQGLMLNSQLLMNNDLAATYAAVNLLVALMQRSVEAAQATQPSAGLPSTSDLTATLDLPDYDTLDKLIRTRGDVQAISADSITSALAGAVSNAQKASASQASSGGSGSRGSGGGGASGSGGSGGIIIPTAGAGASIGGSGANSGESSIDASAEALGDAAASAGSAAENTAQAAAAASGAASAAGEAASAAASAATTMAELSANTGIDAISAILSEILTQNKKSEASMLTAVSPVAASLVDINTGIISTLAALSALNGSVITGVENLSDQFNAILETQAYKAESAYTNYTENISKDIDTTYSTIAGDVSTQVEIIKDMMNADISSDSDGNTNVDLYFTAPEINIDNEVKTQSPDINVENDVNVQPADVNLNPQIDITSPDVSVDLQNNVSVQSPEVTVNTEAPQVNVSTPDVIVPEIQNPDVYIDNNLNPNINVNSEIINTVPNVDVTPEINVTNPDVVVNPQIDNIINQPDINVTPEINNIIPDINVPQTNINNELNVTPEIDINNNVDPEILVDPNITVNPEINNILPKVEQETPNVDIDNQVDVAAPDVNVNLHFGDMLPVVNLPKSTEFNVDDATITAGNLDIAVPGIEVNPEITNTIPNVNVAPEINVSSPNVNVSPEINVSSPDVTVTPEINNIINQPDVNVNSDVTLKPNINVNAPEVNVDSNVILDPIINVNPEIINTVPNVAVDPTVQVEVTSPDISLTPNIDVASPDINIPAIESPDVYVDNTLNPEIVVNPEIVNTVPNVQVDVDNTSKDTIVVEPEINNTVNQPDININPEVSIDADGLVITPDVTVNPEITNTVPNVNIDNEIINTPPEVLVDNNIINQIPPILVHNEIINKAPDVNLVNVNKISTELPDIYVEVKNAVNVQPPQVINTTTFNPNIINTVPDVSVYPEIINNIPDVILNPEIVTNVTPPTVINQSEIVNTVPNVYVEAPEVNVPKSDVYVEAIIPEINNQVKVTPEIVNEVTVPDITVNPEIINSSPSITVETIAPEVTPEIEVMEEINITVPPAPPATVIVEDVEARPNQIIVNPQVDVQAIIPEVILNPDIKVAVPDINLTEDINVSAPPITFNPKIDVLNTVPNVNVSPNIINEIPAPEIAVDPEIIFTVPNITVNPEIINTPPEVQVTSTVVIPDTEQDQRNNNDVQNTDYSRFLLESGVVNTIVSSSSSTSDVSDYLIGIEFADGFKLLVDSVSKIKQLIENSKQDAGSVVEYSEISGFTAFTFND